MRPSGSMEATENRRRQETGISRLILSVLILSRMVQVAHPPSAVSAKTGRSRGSSARSFFWPSIAGPKPARARLRERAGDWASGGGLQHLRERRMAQLLERFAVAYATDKCRQVNFCHRSPQPNQ